MKKVLFIALLIFAALSIYSYGQELTPKQGKNGKYGFVDKQGKEVIPYKYEYVRWFSEGLAGVKYSGKCGFIDKAGNEVIPFKYDDAWNFSAQLDGLAKVKHNEKYGFIDKTGAVIVPIVYSSSEIGNVKIEDLKFREYKKFSSFAQNYVESRINEWQKKDEFEKTADWQNRVNETTRNEKAKQLLKEAEKEFIAVNSPKISIKMELGEYDADNEVFLITSNPYGKLLVSVPLKEAQTFKNNWNTITKTPKYFIENDYLALAEITFAHGDRIYKYNNQASLNYTIANIDYNFAPINVDLAEKPSTQQGQQNISTVNINASKLSDVAKNIPETNITNNKTYAVIIGNENYTKEAVTRFAINDANLFYSYATKTLGIPEKNIRIKRDAGYADMLSAVKFLEDASIAHNGNIKIIFYYSGHGIADKENKKGYLIPVDGSSELLAAALKTEDLYKKITNMNVISATIFLDACFSGASDTGLLAALTDGKGVRITPKEDILQGNIVVFSATTEAQTAYPYEEMQHGLFTYFLLKKIQETQGNANYSELLEYVTNNVKSVSFEKIKKLQTPKLQHSHGITNVWEGWTLVE